MITSERRYKRATVVPTTEPPSYSAVTVYGPDGVTKVGTISQRELQMRPCPVPAQHAPMFSPREEYAGTRPRRGKGKERG